MKITALFIALILVFSFSGCKERQENKNSITKNQSSSKIVSPSSSSTLSSNVPSINYGMLRQTPVAKSKDNLGINEAIWLTLTNDLSICLGNHKTLYKINTKDLSVLKKFDLENVENYFRLKKTKEGFVLFSATNVFKFNLDLELLQKVSVKDVNDISEDFKTILYNTEDGVYISNIERTNPNLIAKSENITHDINGRSFGAPVFVDNEKKIMFMGIGWEYIYAVLFYEVEKSTIKRFDIGGGYGFNYYVFDDRCIFKDENIDIIDFSTLEIKRIETAKVTQSTSNVTNGKIMVILYNAPSEGDFIIKKYDFGTRKEEDIKITNGWVNYTILSILPNNTVIIFDQKNFYRIKID